MGRLDARRWPPPQDPGVNCSAISGERFLSVSASPTHLPRQQLGLEAGPPPRNEPEASQSSDSIHLPTVRDMAPRSQPGSTAYRTPRSAIAFLVVILGLVALLLAIDLESGYGPMLLVVQLLGVFLVFFVLATIWMLARWWVGGLGPIAARCPTCGRGYPKTAGPFCPWDGSKLPSKG
jgi:hypothetical protein